MPVWSQELAGMPLIISPAIQSKLLKRHDVTARDVEECFANRTGRLLIDDRAENRTDPPTRWFIAQTHHGRSLKIVFVQSGEDVFLKTAYVPSAEELRIYRKFGQ